MTSKRLQFRDPEQANELAEDLDALMEEIGRPVAIVHVCGTHEQSIAKYGLRSLLPADLTVRMGPGCPVCVTTMPEVDEAIELSEAGHTVVTYGDMFQVPGTNRSLADARTDGADVRVVYSAQEAVELAEDVDHEVIFFATGFETTAAPTAAILQNGPPANFSVLSAHKYVPPAMEIVAALPETDIDGFLAAGHAATITGYGIFEPFAEEYDLPVVVGGFEPIDVLYGLRSLLTCIANDDPTVKNAYPRCVSREGNEAAKARMWDVFEPVAGEWRGIADIPDANLKISDDYARWNARKRFDISPSTGPQDSRTAACICGDIMAGQADPDECPLFEKDCRPEEPVGACMVSSEGPCRIWAEYGGRPDL